MHQIRSQVLDPAQVRADLQHRAQTEGLTVAYETSLAICKDKAAPASAKAAAAGILMKLAGSGDDEVGAKELFEMDGKELARYGAKLRRQAAALAETIDTGESDAELSVGLFS